MTRFIILLPPYAFKAHTLTSLHHLHMDINSNYIYLSANFTFMLPCIVIDFFLNNQADALIIHIYSVIKLYVFRASSLPIIRSFLLYIRHW